jgi:hypothetical protein
LIVQIDTSHVDVAIKDHSGLHYFFPIL